MKLYFYSVNKTNQLKHSIMSTLVFSTQINNIGMFLINSKTSFSYDKEKNVIIVNHGISIVMDLLLSFGLRKNDFYLEKFI